MIASQSKSRLEAVERQGPNYFFGCLGAAGLIIGASEWIIGGRTPNWLSGDAGRNIGWAVLITLQLLTIFALRRRLLALRRTRLWVLILLMLWISFDLPLALSRNRYIALPLVYGVSQTPLLFNLRKAD
jgi:hypothetical protein